MNLIATLGSFAVIGVIVSLVVEYTKNFFVTQTATHRTLYGLALSVVCGLIVYFWHLIPQAWVTDVVGVIAAVNTAYVFIVQYLPNIGPQDPSVSPTV